jgi:hypothetical protein
MRYRFKLCNMTWILIIVILVPVLLCWLLFSPFQLELDTAAPSARFTWWGIGAASVWYEEGWWMYFRILFFHTKRKVRGVRKEHGESKGRRRGSKKQFPFYKMINCLKTFRIKEWKLSIDTGDYSLNARLYPLNFVPGFQHHLDINFMDRNDCSIKIVNAPWKILYAFLR